ncbi:MAG TPA: hypothetical protein VGR71_17880 [Nitrospira sp.]|nr:hypothetical protein [Nitrospira sp.]
MLPGARAIVVGVFRLIIDVVGLSEVLGLFPDGKLRAVGHPGTLAVNCEGHEEEAQQTERVFHGRDSGGLDVWVERAIRKN